MVTDPQQDNEVEILKRDMRDMRQRQIETEKEVKAMRQREREIEEIAEGKKVLENMRREWETEMEKREKLYNNNVKEGEIEKKKIEGKEKIMKEEEKKQKKEREENRKVRKQLEKERETLNREKGKLAEEKETQERKRVTWERIETEMAKMVQDYDPNDLSFEDLDEGMIEKMKRMVSEAKERGERAERKRTEELMTQTNQLLTQWEGNVEKLLTERKLLKLETQQLLKQKEQLLQCLQHRGEQPQQHRATQPHQEQQHLATTRPISPPTTTQPNIARQLSPQRQERNPARKRYRSEGKTKLMAKVVIGDRCSRERDTTDFAEGDRILAIATANAHRGKSPYYFNSTVPETVGRDFVRWLDESGMRDEGWIQVDSVRGSRRQFEGSICKKCWCFTLDRCGERMVCDLCKHPRKK